jgi:hypothetical protein
MALSSAADSSAVAAEAPRELSTKVMPEVGIWADIFRAEAVASGQLVPTRRSLLISLIYIHQLEGAWPTLREPVSEELSRE